mmetsp:Transcript_28748/g.20807  ORF Transcript_28748/g.20807 Transcript_28748/m.20807 type:complete len:207 (+) Transcript_28748:362-982(+)
MQMLEASGIVLSKNERHESVSIIDSISVLAFHVLEKIVLDNRVLSHGSVLSGGSSSGCTVTKSENVLVLFVLKSVFVNINKSLIIEETISLKLSLRLARWVNASREEVFLDNLTIVNILENSNFLTVFVLVNLSHLPSEHHIDTSLVALIKGNLISIRESVDLLVGSPELNLSVSGSSTNKLVLSHKVFVVKSIEVGTFTLVWELR